MLTEKASDFFDTTEIADSVVFTPAATGISATITAILNRDALNLEADFRDGNDLALAEIIVNRADVSAPAQGDTYLFDSETWRIGSDGIIHTDELTYTIALQREV